MTPSDVRHVEMNMKILINITDKAEALSTHSLTQPFIHSLSHSLLCSTFTTTLYVFVSVSFVFTIPPFRLELQPPDLWNYAHGSS